MAKTLTDILGWETLLGIIEAKKAGLPKVLPDVFWNITSETLGNSGTYTVVRGQRKSARLNRYGAPAKRQEMLPIAEKQVKLLHVFEELAIDPLTYQKLRDYDNWRVQEKGIKELGRQMEAFAKLFMNLEVNLVTSMLVTGFIYFDSDGNILPSSSGADATKTIDYLVDANHRDQLNGIISASWATASTDISLQIRNLMKQSLRDTGYEIECCFYGENVPSYLAKNDYAKDWWVRNPRDNQYWLDTGEIPDGMFGIKKWVPIYKSFFEDKDGANQSFLAHGDVAVFTPAITEDVYEMIEGSYEVPTTFQPQSNLTTAVGSLELVYGDFAYAVATHNPVGVTTYMGFTKLPVWKVPDAIYIADVVP